MNEPSWPLPWSDRDYAADAYMAWRDDERRAYEIDLALPTDGSDRYADMEDNNEEYE